MSYIIPDYQRQIGTPSIFPLNGPSGFTYMGAFFWPGWNLISGSLDFVEVEWTTIDFLSNPITELSSSIANQIADEGQGTPYALRMFYKQEFNVSVPDDFCLPSEIPFVGGCHNIPLIGGTTIVSIYRWRLQLVYHNPLPFLVALAIAIIAVLGFAVTVDLITHNQFDLTQAIKDTIEQSTPGQVAGDISGVIILGIALFAVIAVGVPQLSTQAQVRAGPVSVGAGTSGSRAGRR